MSTMPKQFDGAYLLVVGFCTIVLATEPADDHIFSGTLPQSAFEPPPKASLLLQPRGFPPNLAGRTFGDPNHGILGHDAPFTDPMQSGIKMAHPPGFHDTKQVGMMGSPLAGLRMTSDGHPSVQYNARQIPTHDRDPPESSFSHDRFFPSSEPHRQQFLNATGRLPLLPKVHLEFVSSTLVRVNVADLSREQTVTIEEVQGMTAEIFPPNPTRRTFITNASTRIFQTEFKHVTISVVAGKQYRYQVSGWDFWRPFRAPPAPGINTSLRLAVVRPSTTPFGTRTICQRLGAAHRRLQFDLVIDLADPQSSESARLDEDCEFLPWFGRPSPDRNGFWSSPIGPTMLLTLDPHSPSHQGSCQLKWLERELAKLDRDVTPHVVVTPRGPDNTDFDLQQKMEHNLFNNVAERLVAHHIFPMEQTSVFPLISKSTDQGGKSAGGDFSNPAEDSDEKSGTEDVQTSSGYEIGDAPPFAEVVSDQSVDESHEASVAKDDEQTPNDKLVSESHSSVVEDVTRSPTIRIGCQGRCWEVLEFKGKHFVWKVVMHREDVVLRRVEGIAPETCNYWKYCTWQKLKIATMCIICFVGVLCLVEVIARKLASNEPSGLVVQLAALDIPTMTSWEASLRTAMQCEAPPDEDVEFATAPPSFTSAGRNSVVTVTSATEGPSFISTTSVPAMPVSQTMLASCSSSESADSEESAVIV